MAKRGTWFFFFFFSLFFFFFFFFVVWREGGGEIFAINIFCISPPLQVFVNGPLVNKYRLLMRGMVENYCPEESTLAYYSPRPGRTEVNIIGQGASRVGGVLTFFQVGVCGPDFRSVGLANWYLPLGVWAENFQIWGLVSWKFPNLGACELKISKFGACELKFGWKLRL